MPALLSFLRYWPDAALIRRGMVYAGSFLSLASMAWLSGQESYFWAATASIWTCLADREGTAAERLASLGAVGLGGSLASALGAAVASSPVAAVPLVLVAGIAAGLAETRGPAAALAAKLLYVVLIAACLQPATGPDVLAHLADSALGYLKGGVFACAVCLALIPSRRDMRPRPETEAVYAALQRFATALAADGAAAELTACKQDIRNRIEAARRAIHARRSPRDAHALLHYAYVIGIADALFGLLIVAAELRERAGSAHRLPLRHVARCMADAHQQVSQAMARHAADLPSLSAALRHELRRLISPMPNASAPPPYQAALGALARHPEFEPWRAGFSWPRRGLWHVVDRVRGALGEHAARDALAGRHAIRLALGGCLSLLPAQWWHVDHGYWVAVTVIMVLSPQLQTTRQISLKRFAGSLAGALLACAVGLLHPAPTIALGISAVFLAGAYANRLAAQPAGFAFCLTPAVILFSWVGAPAVDSSHFAALRGIDTALGCLIALASYYILAPRMERSRLLRHALEAVAVNAVYLRAAFAAARTAAPARARLEALRIAAGRASTRAERTLAEHGEGLTPDVAQAYACLHGTARRLAALAGVVRAGAESGSFDALPRSPMQSALAALETRLAEIAIRPGHEATGLPGTQTLAVELVPQLPFECFLAEQADYANAHIAAAHAAAAALREPEPVAAPPGLAHRA
ncbi:FUSC family protein [Cupriavidus sp. WKF15]|uniref:FUSC family protein n=1 Tax=Cupriavidus sp. WKF15 TaxID=3032282 RepID=UPI0023E34F5E|nr:FUSC family protein [Cupriavidus sp. WKF15]WER45791.1 FUSC family protein [Cupriavidus sp. WKF15]